MGSEWKSKNEKGWLSSAGRERESDGALSLVRLLRPSQRVPLGSSLGCPLGFCSFSGLFHALRARDRLCSPPEGSPAVSQEEMGLLCSAGSGSFWGSSSIYKSLIQIILPFFTQIYFDILVYRYIYKRFHPYAQIYVGIIHVCVYTYMYNISYL